MNCYITILLLFAFTAPVQSQLTSREYKEDFAFFVQQINDNYAYNDKSKANWSKVTEIYQPCLDTITRTRSFVLLLEKVLNELYDHHASLSTHTAESQRLVPSGTDVWAEFIGGRPIILEVRKGFGADKCGLTAGMEIVAFNHLPVESAIQPFLPISAENPSIEARNYALRVLLAGKHIDDRIITVKKGADTVSFYPDRPVSLLKEIKYQGDIESKVYNGNIGYVRINNRLGDNNLIRLFDSVMSTLKNTQALILDLRETPSGGNTTVARAILGSFIRKEGYYQKHELTTEQKNFGVKRSWSEIASPRAYVYTKPVVLLVNHWTGSVGEGITIGLDAFKRATIIGTEMAGLRGAVYTYKLPNTGIRFSFPQEKLFHVNGMPREDFKPMILIDLKKQQINQDLVLTTALNYLYKRR